LKKVEIEKEIMKERERWNKERHIR